MIRCACGASFDTRGGLQRHAKRCSEAQRRAASEASHEAVRAVHHAMDVNDAATPRRPQAKPQAGCVHRWRRVHDDNGKPSGYICMNCPAWRSFP